jgi:hypothetical protein
VNATEIAKALNDGPGLHEFHALRMACEARRNELRELTRNAAAREAAALKGLEAIEAHDAEQERYIKELPLLDQIEMALVEAHDAAVTAGIRREMPAALKRLPSKLSKVDAALAELDRAIADANATIATIAEHERLPDRQMPLSDDELAELLQLRDRVWTQRTISTLTPNREKHPRSWGLAFVVKPNGDWYLRKPGPHLPDFATDGR